MVVLGNSCCSSRCLSAVSVLSTTTSHHPFPILQIECDDPHAHLSTHAGAGYASFFPLIPLLPPSPSSRCSPSPSSLASCVRVLTRDQSVTLISPQLASFPSPASSRLTHSYTQLCYISIKFSAWRAPCRCQITGDLRAASMIHRSKHQGRQLYKFRKIHSPAF